MLFTSRNLVNTVIRTRHKYTFIYTLRLTDKIKGTSGETIKREPMNKRTTMDYKTTIGNSTA